MSCARRAATRTRAMRRWGSAVALLLLTPALCFGQDAELEGVVKDQSGAIVPGASITLVAPTTGARRTIATDGSGRYIFSFLNPGTYTITVELNGFQPVARAGVALDSGSRVKLDLVLSPAHISELSLIHI